MPHSALNRTLIFRLGGGLYGAALAHVSEVLERGVPSTWVPRAPFFVRGATSHHGRTILLIDLPSFLGFPPKTTKSIIVLDDAVSDMGFCVDQVLGIVDLAEGPVHETDKAHEGGVGAYADRFVPWKDNGIGLLNMTILVTDIESRVETKGR